MYFWSTQLVSRAGPRLCTACRRGMLLVMDAWSAMEAGARMGIACRARKP